MKEADLEYTLRCIKGNLAMEKVICPEYIETMYREILKREMSKEESTQATVKSKL